MKFVCKLPQGRFCSSHLDHYYHYSVAGRVYEKKAEVEEETERRSSNDRAQTRPPDRQARTRRGRLFRTGGMCELGSRALPVFTKKTETSKYIEFPAIVRRQADEDKTCSIQRG